LNNCWPGHAASPVNLVTNASLAFARAWPAMDRLDSGDPKRTTAVAITTNTSINKRASQRHRPRAKLTFASMSAKPLCLEETEMESSSSSSEYRWNELADAKEQGETETWARKHVQWTRLPHTFREASDGRGRAGWQLPRSFGNR
jgi:DNA-directed RNA polymerase specialized sigma24 family protein